MSSEAPKRFAPSLASALLSYFGNHSDAAGLHFHPRFASGYELLEAYLQLQPEIMGQLLHMFIEGQPFKAVRTGSCPGGVEGTALGLLLSLL